MKNNIPLLSGLSYPLGATVYPEGVNFSIFTKYAEKVELLLFDSEDHSRPQHVLTLDLLKNKTFYYWHCFIPGLKEGQLYGYRVHGPFEPEKGMRFDGDKVLLDPYARAVVSNTYDRKAAMVAGDNCATAMKSVVIDPNNYDWEGDKCLNYPHRKSIIYEMHAAGFTKNPNSGLSKEERGTYKGLVQKIPYLKELGITTVELLPVQQFDPYDAPEGRINYWGYSPIGFFAPHNAYSINPSDPLTVINEFRDMVKAFHKAGLEVILDVVFNHTAEGDHNGPTLCFKGLENLAYYMLGPDKSTYRNYSGTGNTVNANHSIIRRMIRDCLRLWVSEFHIDGFRFDLASVLSRSLDGTPLEEPPLLWEIESDPVLASSKIIAEAWDLEQYQLGNFVGDRWAEWNGKFRDDVRAFIKGDKKHVQPLSNRLTGSPDLFHLPDRNPNRSINFVTAHDGFTLNDLVSYNKKHNWDNGEENRDGHNHNLSWNHGVEGPTDDPAIQALRLKQIKNFFTILLISQGTPMLNMGDEVRRTQNGNNNAYNQDSPIGWFNWDKVEEEKELLHFVRNLIEFNLQTPFFQEKSFWGSHQETASQLHWHGVHPHMPDWRNNSHSLAYSLHNPEFKADLYVIMNAYWEQLQFQLPGTDLSQGREWHLIINTALSGPDDFTSPDAAKKWDSPVIDLESRSVVVFIGR